MAPSPTTTGATPILGRMARARGTMTSSSRSQQNLISAVRRMQCGTSTEMYRPLVFIAAAMGLASVTATAIAASGQVPESPPAPSAPPNVSLSDGTIGKAGAALRDMAKLQQKYQVQIEAASPAQKQDLNEQINAEARQTIRSHGLSPQEYSEVTRAAQNNPQVKQRLLDAARTQ